MKYAFIAQKETVNGEVLWVAKSLKIHNCIGIGESLQEAVEQLEEKELMLDADYN